MADRKLEELTEATSISGDDLLYLKTSVGLENRKVKASTLGLWEEVTVPTDEASWDLSGILTGTWVFNGDGSISQTETAEAMSNTPSMIFTVADFFGSLWAVDYQAKVTAEPLNNPYFSFNAGVYDPNQSDPFTSKALGVGIDNDVVLGDPDQHLSMNPSSIASGKGVGVTVVSDQWHTYRMIAVENVQFAYFDGALVLQDGGYNLNEDNTATRMPLSLGVVGRVTFRNLRAWRIPIPTLT